MDDLQERYGASQRQACQALMLSRSVYRYQSVARDSSAIRMRMREITETYIHYGCPRVFITLRREGWRDNHKRVHRIYCEEGLSMRERRPRRNKSAMRRQPVKGADYPNQVWGMDFVSDALFDGRRLRLLTVIDLHTRECLAITVGQRLTGQDVADTLDRICMERPRPEIMKADNGSEFAGKVLDRWAYEKGVTIDFSRPGKPTDNATVESFNGSLRKECLNSNWFLSLEDAEEKIDRWRTFYNQMRPHSSLEWRPPEIYAEKHGLGEDVAE